MSVSCLDLVSFADGELEPELAEAFRDHLRTCAACRSGLVEAMQLGARLSTLTRTAKLVNRVPGSADGPEPSSAVPVLPRSPPRPKRRFVAWAGGSAAVAAIAAVALLWLPRALKPEAPNAFATLTTRPYDTRTAFRDAARYRPTQDQMRGTSGAAAERISHKVLAELEERKDDYALAIAEAWNGEDPSKVADQLRRLTPNPSIRSDRAAIEVVIKGKDLTSSNEDIESLLVELEALGKGNDLPARAARWNYAILLARLGLPLSAAQAFRAIADDNEPGWAHEARERGQPEASRAQDAMTTWYAARTAGEALVDAGTPVSTELIKRFPGVMRAYFYRAVRTAPNRERVVALGRMAAELDRRGSGPILSNYVKRIASMDFHRRAPLASAYAQLLNNAPLSAAVRAELTDPEASAEVVDIVMGAMDEVDAVADHREAFARMAKGAGDPWFAIVLAQGEASAAAQRRDWFTAEAQLLQAQKHCTPDVAYRCLSLSLQLGQLYQDLYRIPEAVTVLQEALRAARSLGEWGKYRDLLLRLADAERYHSLLATARAYANELLLMAPDADRMNRAGHIILADLAIRDLDGSAARQEIELSLRGGPVDLPAANCLADIGRLDPRPGDLSQLQGWLSKLRADRKLSAAEQVLADEIEGRLVIESDRAAGTGLLERAIAAAGPLRDLVAEKARAGAYSTLAFDAARHGAQARVVALLAQQLGLEVPGPCTVAMVAEDERRVVVVRGADGQDRATYEDARRARDAPLTVSPELARPIEQCDHVRVMANAVLQGQPRALPATLPWSYTTGSHARALPAGTAPIEPRTLIVTDVTPPAYLRLPALTPRAFQSTAFTVTLSGPVATPARVLAEMSGASEIQFHTHAVMDVGVSDASHLVLSAAPDGRYALTAETIRNTELRGHPVVVLAACASAQGAGYQHAPWSLPHAFLAVGARAVFASGTGIPDRGAGAFFDRVLEQIRGGAEPARALRDERMAVLASDPTSWVADVILFE